MTTLNDTIALAVEVGPPRGGAAAALPAVRPRTVRPALPRRGGSRRPPVPALRLAHHSPTAALEDVAEAAAPRVAAIVEGLRPGDGQRGVLVVTGGGVLALDLFDKPSTLAAYWDGLLAGYALDAVDNPGA